MILSDSELLLMEISVMQNQKVGKISLVIRSEVAVVKPELTFDGRANILN